MDKGLDEIISDKRRNAPRNNRRGGDGRRDRREGPRDGVRKVSKNVAARAAFILNAGLTSLLTRRAHPGCLILPIVSLPLDCVNAPRAASSEPMRTHREPLTSLGKAHTLTNLLANPTLSPTQSYRDEPRSIDSEWVHDRFEDDGRRRAPAAKRRRDEPQAETKGTKIRVDNLHYDLTEADLRELFDRIGKVLRLQLRFDRAGRSEGVAFVTYELQDDAEEAIKQFDGANANGQPIRLAIVANRNPFDTAVMPGRPLSERISAPGGRYTEDDAKRRGVDRYIPDGREGGREVGRERSRSPRGPRRRGGRRPGARREGGDNAREGRDGGRGGGRGNPRPKKTQDELDADMDDYFTKNGGEAANGAAAATDAAAPVPGPSDIDMIE